MTRPLPGSIPDAQALPIRRPERPGPLRGQGQVLRQRLNSYFQDPAGLSPRTAQMVQQADHVEWMVVDSESEALLLEHNLIKQLQPRFNVRLKDDKSYPWLAVTVQDEWPRASGGSGAQTQRGPVLRPLSERGGPPRARSTCSSAPFPVRTCSDTKFRRPRATGATLPALPHRTLLGTLCG